MFERELQLLLGAEPREVMELMRRILDLSETLALNHNWMSNTNLATLAEAQGAELFRSNGVVANHRESLRQVLVNIENEEQAITNRVLQIQRTNRAVGNSMFEVLRPLMELAKNVRRIGSNTLAEAARLAQTAPNRLSGIRFEAGERGRATSIVRQLSNQAAQLRSRGIDPSLVPNASAATRTVIAEAESLPAEEREAIPKVLGVYTTMRITMAAQMRAASTAIRAALSRLLGPLETLINFLARSFGSRLTTFIFVPTSVLKLMLKQAGMRSDDDTT